MHALALLLAAVALTPLQKAQLMVVTTERPGIFSGAAHIRFADQEGGLVKALPALAPWKAAPVRSRPDSSQRLHEPPSETIRATSRS